MNGRCLAVPFGTVATITSMWTTKVGRVILPHCIAGCCLNELLVEIGVVIMAMVAYSHRNLSPRRVWRCEAEKESQTWPELFHALL